MQNKGYYSELFQAKKIPHVFLSKTGVRAFPPANISNSAACRPERAYDPVALNYPALADHFATTAIYFTNQSHTSIVHTIDARTPTSYTAMPVCDALVSKHKNCVLALYTADCVPILLADPIARVAAVIHGGWRGLHQNIIDHTVTAMRAAGALPQNIMVAIGPCIRQGSYSVTPDFKAQFPDYPNCFCTRNGVDFCDLPGIAKQQLYTCGIKTIDDVEIDTYAQTEEFYSYRRSYEHNNPLHGIQSSAIHIPL